MPERNTPPQLEVVLASVGRHLVVPEWEPELRALPGASTRRQDEHRARRTLLLVAASIAAVLIVVGLAVAPVRDAVADWLGIGSTSIKTDQGSDADPRGLPSFVAGATPVSRAVARAALGRPVPVVRDPRLGAPALIAVPPEGGVLLAWSHGATTLWAHRDEGDGGVFVKKLLNLGDDVVPIADLGDIAVLIDGTHVLETPARRVAAGRVLLWVEDGLEYRLESNLPRAEMLAAARSVSAARP